MLARLKAAGAASLAKMTVTNKKRKSRAVKKSRISRSRSRALPKPIKVVIPNNYINPITRSRNPQGAFFYVLTNRVSGRKNYMNIANIAGLTGRKMTAYDILMANPKAPLFKNPYTRSNVYPRNLVRATR
jgi:hypothetical protein